MSNQSLQHRVCGRGKWHHAAALAWRACIGFPGHAGPLEPLWRSHLKYWSAHVQRSPFQFQGSISTSAEPSLMKNWYVFWLPCVLTCGGIRRGRGKHGCHACHRLRLQTLLQARNAAARCKRPAHSQRHARFAAAPGCLQNCRACRRGAPHSLCSCNKGEPGGCWAHGPLLRIAGA